MGLLGVMRASLSVLSPHPASALSSSGAVLALCVLSSTLFYQGWCVSPCVCICLGACVSPSFQRGCFYGVTFAKYFVWGRSCWRFTCPILVAFGTATAFGSCLSSPLLLCQRIVGGIRQHCVNQLCVCTIEL